MSSRPRAADDFSPIRARMAELQRERDSVEEQKAKAAQAEAMEEAAQNLAESEAEKPAGTEAAEDASANAHQSVAPHAFCRLAGHHSAFLPPDFYPVSYVLPDGSSRYFFVHRRRRWGEYVTKTEMIATALSIGAIKVNDLRLLREAGL